MFRIIFIEDRQGEAKSGAADNPIPYTIVLIQFPWI